MSAHAYALEPRPAARAKLWAVRSSRHGALVVGLILALAGTCAAYLGARAVSNSEAEQSRLAFHLASAGVASSLNLSVLHEQDLIVAASAYMNDHHSISPERFDRWADTVGAMRRYPELQNIGLVKLVPASQLGAFERQMSTDPLRPFGPESSTAGQPFVVTPPGPRPSYCFAAAGLARSPEVFLPQSIDYCALAPTLLAARDSAETLYAPVAIGRSRLLGVETPVYRAGVVPTTVSARHRAFLGWFGMLLSPERVLGRARAGNPSLALRVTYAGIGTGTTFVSGRIPKHAEASSFDLHNGWTVQTLAAPAASGVIGNWHARLMLAGGTLLSALIGLLVFILASGRRRALELVREKTHELQYQALHDPLTGLANRALLLESAEQLLARSRRTPGASTAALFVDVDGFKQINDTLGHAAGDELLQVFAQRVRTSIRASDVPGRLGGDEFVVLAEADAGSPPAPLAERLVAALRRPIELEGGRKTVYVTASVGVAVGQFENPGELLRLADLALYEAKAEGKDGYVVFDAEVHRDLHALAERAARGAEHSHGHQPASAHPVAGTS